MDVQNVSQQIARAIEENIERMNEEMVLALKGAVIIAINDFFKEEKNSEEELKKQATKRLEDEELEKALNEAKSMRI